MIKRWPTASLLIGLLPTVVMAAPEVVLPTATVNCLAFCDDDLVASGSEDGSVILWDAETRRDLAVWRGHKAAVIGLSSSADGRTLASVDRNGVVTVWDVARRRVASVKAEATAVAVSPGGDAVATGDRDGRVKLWPRRLGEPKHTFAEKQAAVTALAFSEYGDLLAWGTAGSDVGVADVARLKMITGPEKVAGGAVTAVAFSADGKMLWLDCSSQLALRTVEKLEHQASWYEGEAGGPAVGVALGPCDSFLLWGEAKGKVRVANPRSPFDTAGELYLRGWQGVTALALSPNARRLAVAVRRRDDGALLLSKLKPDGRILFSEEFTLGGVLEHPDRVRAAAFAPDGKSVATACEDGRVRLWPIDGEEQNLQKHGSEAQAVAFSPDGKLVASGGRDKLIRVWDLAADKETMVLEGHTDQVRSVAFAPDGKTLASAGADRTVRLWDVASGKERKQLTLPRTSLGLAFAPDGRTLATGGGDGVLRFWDVADGTEQTRWPAHFRVVSGVAYAADGKTIATSCTDGSIKVWDVRSGDVLRQLGAEWGMATGVALSPDGRWLAGCGEDGSVLAWECPKGEEAIPVGGHAALVYGLAFSPDGKFLATAGKDRVARLWRTADWLK